MPNPMERKYLPSEKAQRTQRKKKAKNPILIFLIMARCHLCSTQTVKTDGIGLNGL